MLDFMNSCKLLTIIVMMCMMHSAVGLCNQTTVAKSKDYTVNDWSGSTWNFRGFDVGATSGDFYHLLSSSTDNQCAVMREKANGTQVWAKLYNTGKQCANLKIDPSETKAYFASDESVFTLGVVNCSDGALDSFAETSEATFTTSEANAGMTISPDGSRLIITSDSQTSSNPSYLCNCDVSSLSCS